MTQNQLERQVAHATGEDVRTIAQRGFSIADPDSVDFDPEPLAIEDKIIDWDALDADRNVPVCQQRSRQPAFA